MMVKGGHVNVAALVAGVSSLLKSTMGVRLQPVSSSITETNAGEHGNSIACGGLSQRAAASSGRSAGNTSNSTSISMLLQAAVAGVLGSVQSDDTANPSSTGGKLAVYDVFCCDEDADGALHGNGGGGRIGGAASSSGVVGRVVILGRAGGGTRWLLRPNGDGAHALQQQQQQQPVVLIGLQQHSDVEVHARVASTLRELLHELGHALHMLLSARPQQTLQAHHSNSAGVQWPTVTATSTAAEAGTDTDDSGGDGQQVVVKELNASCRGTAEDIEQEKDTADGRAATEGMQWVLYPQHLPTELEEVPSTMLELLVTQPAAVAHVLGVAHASAATAANGDAQAGDEVTYTATVWQAAEGVAAAARAAWYDPLGLQLQVRTHHLLYRTVLLAGSLLSAGPWI
jgi:hypothetical protein